MRSEAKDTENKLTLEIEKVRGEIKKTENKLTFEIEKIRQEVAINSELLQRDLKIWMGGMLVAAVGALSAIIAVLAHIGRV